MKGHLIAPLLVAGVLLGALPASAGEGGPAFTITASIGDISPRVSYRPPVYAVVMEPAYREPQRIIYVERRKHGRRDHNRRHECGERVRTIERVYYEDDHRHDRRERIGGRVVVDRKWDR